MNRPLSNREILSKSVESVSLKPNLKQVQRSDSTKYLFSEGPLREVFSYVLHTDNSTVTNIDLGKLGGMRETVAVFEGNSLVSYLKNAATNTTDFIATRTILPSKPI